MRIDANIPFDPASQAGAAGTGDAARVAGQAKAAKAQGADPLAPTAQAGYVEQAQNAPEIDLEAVARARALLESGQLDTPQAALDTAQAMLDKGI